jgi:HEAT repeat protein
MSLPAVFTVALFVLGGAAGSVPGQAGAGSKDEVATKVRSLLLAIHTDEPATFEIQTQSLVGLGPAAVPPLLEALESGRVPAAPGAAVEPEELGAAREAVAIRALSHRSRGELLKPALALLERSSAAHTSAVAVRLLGAVGDRRELARLCRTVRPKPDEFVDGELVDAFEAAASEILKRDESASATAHDLLREEQDSVRWSMIRALANAASETTLAILVAELGAHPEDDVFVLEQMTQACASIPPPIPESSVLPVRQYLRNDQPTCVAQAARCLSAMEDTESVEELIELLRSGEPEVLGAAHAALVSITNVGLLPDADRWKHWLGEESAWFRNEFPGLARDLQGGSAIVVGQSIARMAAHPLYRREIAEVLTLALEEQPAALRRLACAALCQLGAKTAIPFLERCAEDPDPKLALEARRALASFAPPRSAGEASTTASDDAQAAPESGR